MSFPRERGASTLPSSPQSTCTHYASATEMFTLQVQIGLLDGVDGLMALLSKV